MAEDSTPVTPPPAVGPPEVPSEAELERIATPATVRRAPRYRAFAIAGVLLGLVVGVVLVLATSGRGTGMTGFLLFFVALGCAVIGAIVGGLVAVAADRRSARPRRS